MGLADASPGSDCWESIKPPTTEHCVAFQGMPTPLSVITGSCHHGAARWMQMATASSETSGGRRRYCAIYKAGDDPEPDRYAHVWNQCLICTLSLFWLIPVPNRLRRPPFLRTLFHRCRTFFRLHLEELNVLLSGSRPRCIWHKSKSKRKANKLANKHTNTFINCGCLQNIQVGLWSYMLHNGKNSIKLPFSFAKTLMQPCWFIHNTDKYYIFQQFYQYHLLMQQLIRIIYFMVVGKAMLQV